MQTTNNAFSCLELARAELDVTWPVAHGHSGCGRVCPPVAGVRHFDVEFNAAMGNGPALKRVRLLEDRLAEHFSGLPEN